MNEKNARLLRQFIRFCGPERLPMRVKGRIVDRGPEVDRPNPIVRDMREVFRRGTSGQRAALAAQLRMEMSR